MPTFTFSFAPQTRTADAAVRAPRKNLRVFGSDTMRLLLRQLYQGAAGLPHSGIGWSDAFSTVCGDASVLCFPALGSDSGGGGSGGDDVEDSGIPRRGPDSREVQPGGSGRGSGRGHVTGNELGEHPGRHAEFLPPYARSGRGAK